MRRVTPWLRRVVVASLLIVCALWLTAYAREWLLRRRAERLLADIQALQVHQSTWADAQRLMTRWGAWGEYEGSCTTAKCSYYIWMNDMIPWEYRFPWEDLDTQFKGPHRLARLLDRLAIRQAAVRAGFRVSNGVITEKNFNFDLSVPVRHWEDEHGRIREEVWADSFEGPHLHHVSEYDYLGDIYSVATFGPHGNLGASSTPSEPLQRRRALMAFDLNCISQWSPCVRVEELLPQAAAEAHAHEDALNLLQRPGYDPAAQIPRCDARRLEFLAREEEEVWIASVEVRTEHDPDSRDPGTLQDRTFVSPQRPLKSRHPVAVGDFIQTSSVERHVAGLKKAPSPALILGEVEDYLPPPNSRFFQLRSCSMTRVNPETLAAVEKGIGEDFDRNAN